MKQPPSILARHRRFDDLRDGLASAATGKLPVFLALVAWVAASPCAAHPVSVSRASVLVDRQRATAKIEVFLEDLYLFHQLQPNPRDVLEADVIGAGIRRHREFVLERFLVRKADGRAAEGRVVGVSGFEVPEDGVPLAKLMTYQLTFELEYTFTEPPGFLTFGQKFTDEQGVLPSEMKLQVQQAGAAEPRTAELRPGEAKTLRFDWNASPLSPEASAAERQRWEERRQQQTLGITSYGSVYSFLYIERHEVRHEILIPLMTLEKSISIARDGDELLDLEEQQAARPTIKEYFVTGNPIEIDGQVIEPKVDRCDFYGVDFKDFAQQAPERPVSLLSARVGLILTYPVPRPPARVQLTWNRFNEHVWAVSTVLLAYDQTSRTTLSRLGGKNTLLWQGEPPPLRDAPQAVAAEMPEPPELSLPLASTVCLLAAPAVLWIARRQRFSLLRSAAAALPLLLAAALLWPVGHRSVPHPFAPRLTPAADRCDAVFASLMNNLYGSFELRQESAVYDALAVSIDGKLLRDIYLQMRRGLEMQEQGGAVSKVESVEIVRGEKLPPTADNAEAPALPGSFDYLCRWNVAGTVEHWGHVHQRTNQYDARFTVTPVDGIWKITAMQLLDQQRVGYQTRLRGL